MSAKNKNSKIVKEYSATEKLKAAQQEIELAAKQDQDEVANLVNTILKERGYMLSARMILEAGKAPIVQPFLSKVIAK